MSNFNTAVFSDIEEIGFRLKAARLESHTSVNIAREGHMTHVAYTSAEDGRGSINILNEVTGIMDKTVAVTVYKNDTVVFTCSLAELRDRLADYRKEQDIPRADIARHMSVPYASVNVFEKAQNPRIRSFTRYIEALGLRAEYVIYNNDGSELIPNAIVDRDQLRDLKNDFKNSMNRDMNDTKVDSRLGDQIKNLRLKLKLSKAEVARNAGIKDASMAKVEQSDTRLVTADKVISAMGHKLEIVVGDTTVSVEDLPAHLDRLRTLQGYTPSDFAREIGTTYRAVKIFPESKVSMASLKRYTDGLKVNIRFKITKDS